MTINAKDIRIIVGIFGTIFKCLISLSQAPRFIQMYKKKSVEEYEPWRQQGMLGKYSLWFLYGLPLVQKDGILVSVANGFGFIVEVVYIVVFLIYCGEDKLWWETIWWLVGEFSAMAAFEGMVIWAIDSDKRFTVDAMSVTCVVYTIGMHAYFCLQTLNDTLNDTDPPLEQMSLGLSLVSFINAGFWIAYSLIHKTDVAVLIVNCVGAFFCACQLIPNAITYKSDTAHEVRVYPQPTDEQILQV